MAAENAALKCALFFYYETWIIISLRHIVIFYGLSQVTFIYIALLTVWTVSKQLYSDNRKLK